MCQHLLPQLRENGLHCVCSPPVAEDWEVLGIHLRQKLDGGGQPWTVTTTTLARLGIKRVNGSSQRTTPSLSTQLRFILVMNLTFGGCK